MRGRISGVLGFCFTIWLSLIRMLGVYGGVVVFLLFLVNMRFCDGCIVVG